MEGHLTPLWANLMSWIIKSKQIKSDENFSDKYLKKDITRPEIENVICLFDCDSDWTELPLAASINVEQEVCDTDSVGNDRIIMPYMKRSETSKDVRFGLTVDPVIRFVL